MAFGVRISGESLSERDLIEDGLLPNPDGCSEMAQACYATPSPLSSRMVQHLWQVANELAREADAFEQGRDQINDRLVALDRHAMAMERALTFLRRRFLEAIKASEHPDAMPIGADELRTLHGVVSHSLRYDRSDSPAQRPYRG